MYVQREGVEAHGADERDPGGEHVEQVSPLANPEALQLGQHVERAKHLQVEHLDVGKPQLKVEGVLIVN